MIINQTQRFYVYILYSRLGSYESYSAWQIVLYLCLSNIHFFRIRFLLPRTLCKINRIFNSPLEHENECVKLPASKRQLESTNLLRFGFMVFNATFNNISVKSWRSVLLMEETGGPGENHQPAVSHWQTGTHTVLLLALSGSRTHNISGDCIGSCKSNYQMITAPTTLSNLLRGGFVLAVFARQTFPTLSNIFSFSYEFITDSSFSLQYCLFITCSCHEHS